MYKQTNTIVDNNLKEGDQCNMSWANPFTSAQYQIWQISDFKVQEAQLIFVLFPIIW